MSVARGGRAFIVHNFFYRSISMTCTRDNHSNSLLTIYNNLLNKENGQCDTIYYKCCDIHDSYHALTYSDIECYFKQGGKENLVDIPELKTYFSDTKDGKKRVLHVFSVYLLGIFCYDHISVIKNAFNKFIKKIWEKTHYTTDSEEQKTNDLRRDFLYLWYLTVLFHDMGYAYESKGDSDDSHYSSVITSKSMNSKENLDCHGPILGIPDEFRKSTKDYFYQRRENILFNENRCTDHGFAGGFILAEKLKELHCCEANETPEILSPVGSSSLIFSPAIFQWYNIPSAWAIICHNLWLAEEGTGRVSKYKLFGLDKFIYPKERSPISYIKHPLLFLLDFIDTIDFVKRLKYEIEYLDAINVSYSESSISFSFNCLDSSPHNPLIFLAKDFFEKMRQDTSFLESQTFSINYEQNCITFTFL